MAVNKIFNRELKNRKKGSPLFKGIKYCTRCCMPETNEFQKFDEMGICNACRSSEQKMRIDWSKREKKLKEIKSPMVGTFYSAASPDAQPFIKVGDTVKKGDTVCIVEAMKLMNELPSEIDGEVVEICVSNGEAISFGQVIAKLK